MSYLNYSNEKITEILVGLEKLVYHKGMGHALMCTVKIRDNNLLKVLQIFEKIHFECEKSTHYKRCHIFSTDFL